MDMTIAIPMRMADPAKAPYNRGMTERGDRIRQARRAMRLSQEELAGRMDVTQPLVSQWEHGRKALSADQLKTLAEILGVTPGWLLYGGTLTEHETGTTLPGQTGYVPMVSLADAIARRGPQSGAQTIRAQFPCSPKSYWFEMPNDSCSPTFPRGSVSVWDPEAAATPGSIVLALSGADAEPVIGELRYETTPTGRVAVVTPLNEKWASARSDHGPLDVIAVMTENTRQVAR